MYKTLKTKIYPTKNDLILLRFLMHTSKASFIDNDSLTYTKEKPSFSGKRTKRGLYVSKSGMMINADLNAALNIIRKCNPDVSKKLGSIGLNTPKRTYLFTS